MNTGFLSDPAPSNGYDAVLGALAPHAAPAEGSLGNFAPSVQNRVKQTFINPVATYPFIARKWTQGWEQSFHPGDLMFIFIGETTGVVSTTRHSILANLPVLNTIMRETNSNNEFKKFGNIDDWTFIGVMRNSSAASGLNPTQQIKRGGNAFSPDRIINIDVRGSTRMFNYWEDARAGEHLMLAWAKVNVKKLPNVMGTPKEDAGFPDLWQLLPFSKSTQQPENLNIKVWENEQVIKSLAYRPPVCVGWVFQHVGAGELSSSRVTIRMATQLAQDRFKLPMVHTFLHV